LLIDRKPQCQILVSSLKDKDKVIGESRLFFGMLRSGTERFRARQKTQQAAFHFAMSWNTGQILEIHITIRKGDRVLIHDDPHWRYRNWAVKSSFPLMGSVSLTEGKKLRNMMFFYGNDNALWSHNSGSQWLPFAIFAGQIHCCLLKLGKITLLIKILNISFWTKL
jgi:hypothetical protein